MTEGYPPSRRDRTLHREVREGKLKEGIHDSVRLHFPWALLTLVMPPAPYPGHAGALGPLSWPSDSSDHGAPYIPMNPAALGA